MKKSSVPANKTDVPVQFRMQDAQRIASVVHTVETARRGSNASALPRAFSGGSGVRLAKTTAAWPKGAVSTIELYEEGTPPLETRNASNYTLADCVNKFSDIDANKWVMVAKASNGRWYLISAECG